MINRPNFLSVPINKYYALAEREDKNIYLVVSKTSRCFTFFIVEQHVYCKIPGVVTHTSSTWFVLYLAVFVCCFSTLRLVRSSCRFLEKKIVDGCEQGHERRALFSKLQLPSSIHESVIFF